MHNKNYASINCDKPDLLLCYTPGAAGRLLVHLVMLSPGVPHLVRQVYGNVAERLCNSLITSTTWVRLPPFTTKHTMP